jgi:hypothetical protein
MRYRAVLVLHAVMTAVVVTGSLAYATHNDTIYHVGDQDVIFRLDAGTLNTDQRIAITDAAKNWEVNIGKYAGGLDFDKGTNYTGGSPATAWDNSGMRLVWEGAYPSSWGCAAGVVTCTRNYQVNSSDHIEDLDTVYKQSIAWKDDGSECVEPFDAIDGSDGRADQTTAALQAWGTWYRLNTSGLAGAYVMQAEANGQCWGGVASHDVASGYAAYGHHPSHNHIGH